MKKLLITSCLILVALVSCKKDLNFSPLNTKKLTVGGFNPKGIMPITSSTWDATTNRLYYSWTLSNKSDIEKKIGGALTLLDVSTLPTVSICQNSGSAANHLSGSFGGGIYNVSTNVGTGYYQFSSTSEYNRAKAASCVKFFNGVYKFYHNTTLYSAAGKAQIF